MHLDEYLEGVPSILGDRQGSDTGLQLRECLNALYQGARLSFPPKTWPLLYFDAPSNHSASDRSPNNVSSNYESNISKVQP